MNSIKNKSKLKRTILVLGGARNRLVCLFEAEIGVLGGGNGVFFLEKELWLLEVQLIEVKIASTAKC